MLYDLAIIGAGASGIMAALEASKNKLNVCIIEQNSYIGKKLAITGGGRCNITSNVDIGNFQNYIPRNHKFLQSALKQFSNLDLIRYFESLGIEVKSEDEKMYLKSENGKNLIDILKEKLNENSVEIRLNEAVIDVVMENNSVSYLKTTKESLKAKKYLFSTGGLSYKELGSDGSMFKILESKNIFNIMPTFPCLVPINLKNNEFMELSGSSIIANMYLRNGKIKKSLNGELLFTHKGISGPLALNFSSYIVDLDKNSYEVWIDFLSTFTEDTLRELFTKIKGKERISKVLKDLLPKNLIKVLFKEESYDFSNLKKKDLEFMISNLKKHNIEIDGFEGYNKAIITRGGIDIKEIDPKTLKSKKIDNLYFAGEMLDIDGFTGGYNLQIAFSTGYVAGKNIGGI